MIFAVASVLFLASSALAGGCASNNNNPLNIRKQLYYTSCSKTDPIQPQKVSVTDAQGNVNYPIDVSKPLYISAISKNNGNVYKSTLVDVVLYQWTKSFFQSKCQWNKIITFGLLNNINGCKIGGNCPLQKGDLTLKVDVDLSPYKSIIEVLGGDTPYEIEIHIHENDDGKKTEITCLTVGAMIAK